MNRLCRPLWIAAAAAGFAVGCRQVGDAMIDYAEREGKISSSQARGSKAAFHAGLKYAQSHQDILPRQEFYIGRTVAARLFQRTPAYANDAAADYVTRVGLTLAQVSDRPEVYGGYHFAVVDAEEPNAFTCPAGLILLTRGAVRLCETEDELAAVLAHELSHAALKHPLQAIKDVNSIPILTAEALSEYAKDDERLKGLTKTFGSCVDGIMDAMYKTGYKPDYEFAADAMAVEILARAGYDPGALGRVLGRMPAGKGQSATHPKAKDRIARVEKVLAAKGPAPAVEKARTWRFLAAKTSF